MATEDEAKNGAGSDRRGRCFYRILKVYGLQSSALTGDFHMFLRIFQTIGYCLVVVAVPCAANTTFTKSQSLPAEDPTALTIAHWAGRDQIVATNNTTHQVVVYRDNGSGTFDSGTAYNLDINLNQGRGPVAVAIGLLDATQGLQGVAVANKSSNNVSVFRANATTAQLDSSHHDNFDTGHAPAAVAFASYSSQDYDDLLVANSGDNTVTIFIGAALGSFASTLVVNVNPPRGSGGSGGNGIYPDCAGPNSLAVIRPDALDARDRFIVTCETTGSAVIFTNVGGAVGGAGTPSFVATGSALAGNSPSHVTLGDFDHDGIADFAITSYADNQLHVTFGANFAGGTYATGAGPSSVVAGSFTTGSTGADLAVANFVAGTASLFINQPNGVFLSGGTIPIASFADTSIAIAAPHVSRTDLSDLVIANRLDDVRVLFNTSLPDSIFSNGFDRNTGGL
jgi:trimeric autotransporter adhesin